MSTAIEIKDISPEKTLETCARQIIVSYFREMMSHKTGAIDGTDIKFVHDMRVASRRLRAAMDNFADCFQKDTFKKHYKQIQMITRTMGAVRDLDVLIARFQRELQSLSGAEQGDIQGLIEQLQHERKEARKPMLNLFTELDARDFGIQFLTFFEVNE
ncbi:MAG: CHAD domain-containing protein [Candidatus Poribacteria bacterium]|nr:CHAD domain-containing protein [Candidatus Poribacteria bacterium]